MYIIYKYLMDKELIFFLEYIFVKMGGPFTRAVFGSKKHFSEQDVDEFDQLTTVRERLGKNERCLHIIIYILSLIAIFF